MTKFESTSSRARRSVAWQTEQLRLRPTSGNRSEHDDQRATANGTCDGAQIDDEWNGLVSHRVAV